MLWREEWKNLLVIVGGLAVFFYLPLGWESFDNAVMESLRLAKWYANEHVLLCLVPAFFIAGAIGVFISQAAVMKYLGVRANKFLAYGVASASGTILAVCSCTVLPLFSGIYRMGAGLGPATAFLYSGPAINILAIVLTAKVLGADIGVARALGAILFSVVIGLMMHFVYRKEEVKRAAIPVALAMEEPQRSLWKNVLYFASMIGILVFANWAKPDEGAGLWADIYGAKWLLTAGCAAALGVMLVAWLKMRWWKVLVMALAVGGAAAISPSQPQVPFIFGVITLMFFTSTAEGEAKDWFVSSWDFAKQILPLLLLGVLVAGFLLGRPEGRGIIPPQWIAGAVGGNSLQANFLAAFFGAFMYFATLTEIPILHGLLASGMGKGPALALLLAGPALSLPSMLVIRSVLGTGKTVVFVTLVIVMATISGMLFGALYG